MDLKQKFQKPILPLRSDAPVLLRRVATTLRTRITPLVRETLLEELHPTQQDFQASDQLAAVLEKRADLIEKALEQRNRTGRPSREILEEFIAISHEIEPALLSFAQMTDKLKARDKGFIEMAGKNLMRHWTNSIRP